MLTGGQPGCPPPWRGPDGPEHRRLLHLRRAAGFPAKNTPASALRYP